MQHYTPAVMDGLVFMLEFEVGGKTVSAYMAVPQRGRGAGVLVLHAWWGLNEFFTGFCDRLAKVGFVALAPDLYHGKTASTIDEAKRLISRLSRSSAFESVSGAAQCLHAHSAVTGGKLGVVGFSMGAFWAMMLADSRPDDFAAVVLFYGARKSKPKEGIKTGTAFLGHFAQDDEYEPLESIRRAEKVIRSSGREVTFHVYPGTMHWFFEANRPGAYNSEAADLAWKRTVDFLQSRLQPSK